MLKRVWCCQHEICSLDNGAPKDSRIIFWYGSEKLSHHDIYLVNDHGPISENNHASGLVFTLSHQISYTESGLTDTLSDALGLLLNISTGVEASHLQSLDTAVASALEGVLVKFEVAALAGGAGETSQRETDGTSNNESSPLSNNQQDQKQEEGPKEREIIVRALVVLSNILPVNPASASFMSERHRAVRIVEFTKVREQWRFVLKSILCFYGKMIKSWNVSFINVGRKKSSC